MTETIPSSADVITFYEDRAQVIRRATVALAAGRHELSVAGVSVLADDTTMVARIVDVEPVQARVLTSRLHRRVKTVQARSESEIAALEEDQQVKRTELELARRQLSLRSNARDRLVGVEQSILRAMYPVPSSENTTAMAWRDALERLGTESDMTAESHADAVERLAAARRAESRATLLLEQARAEHPEIDAVIEVQVEVEEDGQYVLEFEYYTPCALWRPSHVARLGFARDTVELQMLATVWQQTGERWKNVRCRFSTARPTRAAEAPLLSDDWLQARPKTDDERRVVRVEARDVDIATTGSERTGQVDQMPGVDDGGEPLTLEAMERVTIPSTGEPFRVETETVELSCETDLVAYPERSTVPYLRARGTWDHERPILAGPVVVMRGNEYAGRSRIDFVAPGETFELGCGADSGISVHRTQDDEHKTTAVIGKNILQRTIKVFVSNLSSERRHLTIIERIPVSEIEEVEVKKVDAAVDPDEDGFVEFAATLEPREVETHEIRYRVEYGSKVHLMW